MPPCALALAALSAISLLPIGLNAQQLVACPTDRYGPRAECGTVTVAEHPARPEGRTIPITFAVLRAEHPGNDTPVLLLAGGPGQGSTALAGLANGPFAPVRASRDIVLVDQRGTGGSSPLACERDLNSRPAIAFGQVFDPGWFAQCRRVLEQHADLGLYHTDLAAADLDAVRRALGYPQVILWGGSYGTRLAQAYMRRFPDRVAATVLDGVVPFDFGAPSTYARSAEESLERTLADCAALTSCRNAYPGLDSAFRALIRQLRAQPARARIRRDRDTVAVAMSAGDFGYAVRGLLYNSNGIRRLPAMIHRAARSGDLSEFAQAYWQRAAGLQAAVAEGLHLSIFCAEDVPFVTASEARDLSAGTFFEGYLWEQYAGACREWAQGSIAPDFRLPLQSDIPTLLVSGVYDPVTPPAAATRAARELSNARHLVVPNEAHGAGFGCARPAVLHVLLTARLDGLPAVCGEAGPIDFTPSP